MEMAQRRFSGGIAVAADLLGLQFFHPRAHLIELIPHYRSQPDTYADFVSPFLLVLVDPFFLPRFFFGFF